MIIANGDSFVHEYHLREQDRWSNKINVDINLAIGGGSNDRTFWTTIEALQQYKVDILILGWTAWQRSFFNKSNGSRYKLAGGTAIDETNGDNDTEVGKLYVTKVFNEFTQLKNTLTQILHIQDFCKTKGIKLINFATVFDANDLNEEEITRIAATGFMSRENRYVVAEGTKENRNILANLIDKLDSSCWINNELFSSMETILTDYPKLHDGHIGFEGANKWAEILSKHLH